MFSLSSNYTDDTVMTMAVADWAMKCKAAGETGMGRGREYICGLESGGVLDKN